MKSKAEVTLEAAIVVPLIILIVASILYLSFFVHDLLVLKSYAYSAATENAEEELDKFSSKVKQKMTKAPTLVVKVLVDCYKEGQQYIVSIKGAFDNGPELINQIVQGININVKVQKEMDTKQIQLVNGMLSIAEGE